MAQPYSVRTRSILIASGWHESRAADIEQIEREISDRYGIVMPQRVQRFLTEFAGITLAVPHANGEIDQGIAFDAIRGAEGFQDVLLDKILYGRLCNHLKGKVYPVGAATDSSILLREDGTVFSLDDLRSWIGFWGRTCEEALEYACSQSLTVKGIPVEPDLTLTQSPGSDFEKEKIW